MGNRARKERKKLGEKLFRQPKPQTPLAARRFMTAEPGSRTAMIAQQGKLDFNRDYRGANEIKRFKTITDTRPLADQRKSRHNQKKG